VKARENIPSSYFLIRRLFMPDPLEITRDITVAWLNAYETDLAVRRQKGVVPVFTPTNEEVTEFVSAVFAKVSTLVEEEKPPTKSTAKKKSS
jgi:hypothetical protein